MTELAIVMVIVGLLAGGMMVTLSGSKDIADISETRKQLSTIGDALAGFAAAQGRLPCPASADSNGRESYCTSETGTCGTEVYAPPSHGRCSTPYDGFLPAATLGIAPTDAAGFAIDPWGHRVRYAVTQADAGSVKFPFTSPGGPGKGLKGAWAADPASLDPDLKVCSTSTGSTNSKCAANASLTDKAVAIVFSTGRNGGATPSGSDELANWTTSGNKVFVNAMPNAAFDDIVTWLSANVLYNRMIAAGRLP